MKKNNFPRRKEIPAYSLANKIKRYIKSRGGGVLRKRLAVSFVEFGSKKYKRIYCNDDSLPRVMEELLEEVEDSQYFPAVLIRYENDLWVEYIAGNTIEDIDESLIKKIASFYCYLYKKKSQFVSSERYIRSLKRDLVFLNDMNIIDDDLFERLMDYAKQIAPENLWVGLDYTDSIKKNFVIEENSENLFAIDIESLQDNKIIGTGIAKAKMVWLDDQDLALIFNEMLTNDSPPFYDYFMFIQLKFRAQWLKSIFLRKKWKKLNSDVLRELL